MLVLFREGKGRVFAVWEGGGCSPSRPATSPTNRNRMGTQTFSSEEKRKKRGPPIFEGRKRMKKDILYYLIQRGQRGKGFPREKGGGGESLRFVTGGEERKEES